jgi:hypothetical protein
MSGILDRLRQSYLDRSGKELNQTLNALPWIMIVIGGIVTRARIVHLCIL